MTGRPRPPLSRRTLIGTGLGVAVLAAAGTGTARAAQNPSAASAPRRAQAFLAAAMDAYPDHGTIRLAQSYSDQAGLFSTAFTYDNALAILAYLADDRPSSLVRARALGDALLFAQAGDPQHNDGRLRQAYNVGPYTFYDGTPQPDGFVRTDGKANVGVQFGFTGTAAGDMAWAGIALARLAGRTRSARYRAGAARIGEWIARLRSDQPLGGYRFGVDGGNQPLPFSSTEHNIDLTAFFRLLATLTCGRVSRANREHAAGFVERMFEPGRRLFWTGTDDGTTINRNPIPED